MLSFLQLTSDSEKKIIIVHLRIQEELPKQKFKWNCTTDGNRLQANLYCMWVRIRYNLSSAHLVCPEMSRVCPSPLCLLLSSNSDESAAAAFFRAMPSMRVSACWEIPILFLEADTSGSGVGNSASCQALRWRGGCISYLGMSNFPRHRKFVLEAF